MKETPPGFFVVAGVIAAVPLLVLAAAAPGGDDWVWLEYPRRMTLIAAALGIGMCFAQARGKALLVLVGTVVFAIAWELSGGTDARFVVKESIARAAPWVVGGAYAVLAWLSIARTTDTRTNRHRAGLWLVGVGLVALAITSENRSWLTLENIDQRGTFRSSVAWPDTKKISLVLDLVALAAGLFALLYNPRGPDRLPRATLRD